MLILNGYSDWRLPSIKQFADIYSNLYKAGIAGFSKALYWSNTEYIRQEDGNRDYAYIFNTYSGSSEFTRPKVFKYLVRAIRKF